MLEYKQAVFILYIWGGGRDWGYKGSIHGFGERTWRGYAGKRHDRQLAAAITGDQVSCH